VIRIVTAPSSTMKLGAAISFGSDLTPRDSLNGRVNPMNDTGPLSNLVTPVTNPGDEYHGHFRRKVRS